MRVLICGVSLTRPDDEGAALLVVVALRLVVTQTTEQGFHRPREETRLDVFTDCNKQKIRQCCVVGQFLSKISIKPMTAQSFQITNRKSITCNMCMWL